jgi:hypothetical protein
METKKQKTATLLIISNSKPLSSQLRKFTGDPWNVQDFEKFGEGDFIRHKETGKNFVVITKTIFDELSDQFLKNKLAFYRQRYKLTAIRRK